MIQIHPADIIGEVKPLEGVNLGPVDRYWTREYTMHDRQAKIPSVRVHDASLSVPDTVELHCIFPNLAADLDDPANYQFGATDGYFAAIREGGATIDFRIGEAIDYGLRSRPLVVGWRRSPPATSGGCWTNRSRRMPGVSWCPDVRPKPYQSILCPGTITAPRGATARQCSRHAGQLGPPQHAYGGAAAHSAGSMRNRAWVCVLTDGYACGE